MTRRRTSLRIGRTLCAAVLLILGTLLTMEGILYLWADNAIFNSHNFAVTAVSAAKAPPVKSEISRVLVDQAVKAKPDLVSVRPLIETVIETIIATPVFRRLLVPAVTELHRSVFNSSQRSITLNISDGLTVAISGLRVLNPQLANQIPPDVKTGLISIGQRGVAPDISRSLDNLHTLMLALGIAGVVLLAGAVGVSHNRRDTIVVIGISFTVLSLLLFLALGVGRQFLVSQIDTDSTASAAGSVFDTFTASLRTWLWIIGIGGVLVAAAASASIRSAGARAQIEGARRLATRLPSSRWVRAGYALLAVVLGAGLVLVPSLTLLLLLRAVGLAILYLGGTELLRLSGLTSVAPRAQRTRTEQVEAVKGLLVVRLAATGVLVVALFVGGAALWMHLSGSSSEADVAEAEGPQRCNGYVELCDRPLNQVAFAATHNSQSAADVPGFYFAEQLHGVRSQLDGGVRALLMKTHYAFETKRGVLTDIARETEQEHKELTENLGREGEAAVERLQASIGQRPKNAESDAYLCHGFCELGAVYMDDALTDINDFLDQNPNEVIIVFFGDYVSPSDTEDSFIRTGLIDRVYTHPAGKPWPTLRQLIDLDQRVLVLSENAGNAPKPDWYQDGWNIVQDTPYTFNSPANLQADASCAVNRGKPDAPLFLINNWIQSQTPSQDVAAKVNAYDFLLGRIRRCQQSRGLFPNIIAVDFSEKGDLFRVVDTINGVGEGKPAATEQPGATGTPRP